MNQFLGQSAASLAASGAIADDCALLRLVEAAHEAGGAAFWEMDVLTGSFILSAASARLHGLGGDASVAVSGAALRSLIVAEDKQLFDEAASLWRQGLPSGAIDYRVADLVGGHRWIRSYGTPDVGSGGKASRIVGFHFDGTVEGRVRQALQDRRLAYRTTLDRIDHAFDAGRDAVFDADLSTGSCIVSPSWIARIAFVDPPQTIEFWENLIHPEDRPEFDKRRHAFLSGAADAFEHENRQRCADGSYIWVLMRVKPVEPTVKGYPNRVIGTLIDMTERKETALRIAWMAEHDGLTGLYNRHKFRSCLKETLDSAGPSGTPSLLVCDIDRFSAVNDTYGYQTGDTALAGVAKRIAEAVPDATCVARIGGDEFALVVADGGEAAATAACTSVIAALGAPVAADGRFVNIRASIGFAVLTDGIVDPDDLLQQADLALYSAKHDGRNTFRGYEEVGAQRALRRGLALEARDAARNDQFEFLYQPVVNVRTGAITSFEALMHWRHPTLGLLPPSIAVPIAEETGVIVALGACALLEACREAMHWPASIRVAVNVSALQLTHDLRGWVLTALVKAGLPASRLKLEVAEGALMDEPEAKLAILNDLRQFGIRIALDDFGKGFCSLNHVRRFPFDKIKLDRTFIGNIAEDETSAIVHAVIEIGDGLSIGVVADGIVTAEQLNRVRQEGCEELQGAFLSPPLTVTGVRDLLATDPPWKTGTEAGARTIWEPVA